MFLTEWREFPPAPCLAGKKNLMTARISMLLKSRASLTCFRACFLYFFVLVATILSYTLNKITWQNVLMFSKYINQKYVSTRNSKALVSLQYLVFEHSILRRVLRDFASTRLDNLHKFSNSSDNFRFRAFWHKRFLAALVLCWKVSRIWRHCEAISHVCGLVRLVI